MCDPVTALTVASGAFSAYSQYQQGVAESQYYSTVAKQKEIEGKLAVERGQKQSELIQDTAKMEGKQFQRDAAQFKASQRAQLAASGIYGVTAEDIALDTLDKQRLDEMTLRYNADVKSYETTEGAKFQNYALQSEASQLRTAGKNAKRAAGRNMFSTLLGTATTVRKQRLGYY